ncbi:hypothetical protein [Tahibacter harae]|uniref:Uncharacterized protein n=1 Tax=Tahibacter harae TaxID=2963937 RepID=A0ABT1QRG0_9GAMM|nr:hypothetical protein [Tahibacter harae]MCQ4164837.1 hypothetical protein [Tahibacter harae]
MHTSSHRGQPDNAEISRARELAGVHSRVAATHVVHPAGQPQHLIEIGAPSFTRFCSRDGVPDAVSVSVRTDAEDFVRAASPLGLARYDGRRWNADPDPALAESADSLWLDQKGTLWAAFAIGPGPARRPALAIRGSAQRPAFAADPPHRRNPQRRRQPHLVGADLRPGPGCTPGRPLDTQAASVAAGAPARGGLTAKPDNM